MKLILNICLNDGRNTHIVNALHSTSFLAISCTHWLAVRPSQASTM